MNTINLSFSQCKAIVNAGLDLRDSVERLNDQPEFMSNNNSMGINSIGELKAILQCGCASNAHKSVYYYDANQVMAQYGDDVIEYLEVNSYIEDISLEGKSWTSLASDLLVMAVESWCSSVADIAEVLEWD